MEIEQLFQFGELYNQKAIDNIANKYDLELTDCRQDDGTLEVSYKDDETRWIFQAVGGIHACLNPHETYYILIWSYSAKPYHNMLIIEH